MAVCEKCGGTGRLSLKNPTKATLADGVVGVIDWIFCPENCLGGQVSCCEGFERDAGVAGVDAPPRGIAYIPPEIERKMDEHNKLLVEEDFKRERGT